MRSDPETSADEAPISCHEDAIPALIQALAEGDRGAFDRLFSMVYPQIRALARRRMAESGAQLTLSTTGLVHETYLKLAGAQQADWQSAGEFFGVASSAMRQVLIDFARRRMSEKRGGGLQRLDLEGAALALDDQAEALCELDLQLRQLAELDPRLVRLIECRFFAGLNEAETAAALNTSISTVQRDWVRARAWFAARGSIAVLP
jgi:RNA polymerase sigma factor (TIGR02999 family)